MQNDEAIYSYAVERMIDTGDWLTPRAIPADGPFLEKPPLKFWLVSAGILSGLLPRNEAGMRFIDGVFGGVALVYVFLIGRQLAGQVCGLTACLVLFTIDPLLFDHGLRSNNMDASVVLGYAGGMYHFARWALAPARARGHAAGVAAYFYLALMTKLVAALFLPAICVAALLWGGRPAKRLAVAWKDWLWPSVAVIALATPWFAYQTAVKGEEFWDILIGQHVYRRFTSSLDVSHLHPWHFYFTATWHELGWSGSQIVVGLGVALLAYTALRGRPWVARLVVLWLVVPYAAMSVGTSKLLHYAYPFLAPLGLGAGLLVASVIDALDGAWVNNAATSIERLFPRRLVDWFGTGARLRRSIAGLALIVLAIAALTAAIGPWRIRIGQVSVFSNSSVFRPLVFSFLLLCIVGYALSLVRLVGAIALLLLLPVGKYVEKIQHMSAIEHPLRATRDCMAGLVRAGKVPPRGVFSASGNVLNHTYYYYLWREGPWVVAKAFSPDELQQRLLDPARQTPILIAKTDFERVTQLWDATASAASGQERRETVVWNGLAIQDTVALLLPGPYGACFQPVREAGGAPLWRSSNSGPPR
ncbi:MAG TPA: hypothetical protein VFV98_09235 [Vicinamibacterales bacterium]|nr:hypothetical protein [Vicinamibacterales bacterium]